MQTSFRTKPSRIARPDVTTNAVEPEDEAEVGTDAGSIIAVLPDTEDNEFVENESPGFGGTPSEYGP